MWKFLFCTTIRAILFFTFLYLFLKRTLSPEHKYWVKKSIWNKWNYYIIKLGFNILLSSAYNFLSLRSLFWYYNKTKTELVWKEIIPKFKKKLISNEERAKFVANHFKKLILGELLHLAYYLVPFILKWVDNKFQLFIIKPLVFIVPSGFIYAVVTDQIKGVLNAWGGFSLRIISVGVVIFWVEVILFWVTVGL